MIRDPAHETMPRPELEKLQLERLKVKVREVYDKVSFYRRAFKEKGVTPDDIKTLADLTKLRSDANSVMDKKVAVLLAEDEDGAAKLKERAKISGRIEALNTELKARLKKDAEDKKAKQKKDAEDRNAKLKKDTDDKKAKANKKKRDEIRAKIEALNTELKAVQ
jgi:hypothetical protein